VFIATIELALFGLNGIIVGPLVACLFHTPRMRAKALGVDGAEEDETTD
jgi:hypothetical protein